MNGLTPEARLPAELFIPAMSTEDVAQLPATSDVAGASSNAAVDREHLVRFGWPTKGIITQYFWEFHPGIDIANDVGTPELAADAGQVVFSGWGDYGIYVEIDHGNGFHTVYGHMSRTLVSTGQMVTKGQLIGLMGYSGTASHTKGWAERKKKSQDDLAGLTGTVAAVSCGMVDGVPLLDQVW